MSNKSSSNIVLVGAGGAGFPLFRDLEAKLSNIGYNLIVVEPRKFVVHLPSTIRMVVTPEGGYEKKSIMDHTPTLTSDNVRFVYAEVTSIIDDGSDGGHVELNNGESVDYSCHWKPLAWSSCVWNDKEAGPGICRLLAHEICGSSGYRLRWWGRYWPWWYLLLHETRFGI